MSSCVILKEDQSGCQPWELTNFDTHSSSVTNASAAGITLPTIERIAAIEEQARQEGYKSGHALNNTLLRALLADENAWELVVFPTDSLVPVRFNQPALVN